jgi:ElaB/YqjD/DUF883 family membrane-anchored ribosome-binding protein
MTIEITDTLRDDLYEKTRAELNTFLAETNALLAAGDALHEDRTALAQERLAVFLRGAANVVLSDDDVETVGRSPLVKARDYVTAHPWHAVGVAAAAGLLVSVWLNRR